MTSLPTRPPLMAREDGDIYYFVLTHHSGGSNHIFEKQGPAILRWGVGLECKWTLVLLISIKCDTHQDFLQRNLMLHL